MPGIGIQLAVFVVPVVDHRPRTAAVTAHPTCVHGDCHGPPDLPARHPSRPTRTWLHGTRHGPPGPGCTAPVTAHPDLAARHLSRPTRPALHGTRHGSCTDPPRLSARTPHGSLHGLSRLFAAPSESGFHAWCAGRFLLDSPVKSSSAGFRRCGDRATTTLSPAPHGSCTAFHGLFTAPPLGQLRGAPVISSSIRRSNLLPRVSAGAATVRRRLRARLLHGLSRPFHCAPRRWARSRGGAATESLGIGG
jgi:hypothetical protein